MFKIANLQTLKIALKNLFNNHLTTFPDSHRGCLQNEISSRVIFTNIFTLLVNIAATTLGLKENKFCLNMILEGLQDHNYNFHFRTEFV